MVKQVLNYYKQFAQSTFSKNFIRSYSKVYGINIEEVSQSIERFSSLHDFFIRNVERRSRPIAYETNVFEVLLMRKLKHLVILLTVCNV